MVILVVGCSLNDYCYDALGIKLVSCLEPYPFNWNNAKTCGLQTSHDEHPKEFLDVHVMEEEARMRLFNHKGGNPW